MSYKPTHSYLKKRISLFIIDIIASAYNTIITEKDFIVNTTKPEFNGDYTVVLFSLTKKLNTNIKDLATNLGEHLLQNHSDVIASHNLTVAFLNISITASYLLNFLNVEYANNTYSKKPFHGKKVMVEYSSPNTNKPLHLGHLRNNFLGYSIAEIYKWNGYDVFTSCIVNDRGMHICKSMLAWQKWGNGKTPSDTNQKGDHFVGDYYVLFASALKQEIAELQQHGLTEKEAEQKSLLMQDVQKMLVLWEQGDAGIMQLWNMMNGWVYEGFDFTYKKIGTTFDRTYYESKTYLLGKKFVEDGLQEKRFFKKEDHSVWTDLTKYGLDEKLLLRKDGTSVYITQDLGLAENKFNDFAYNTSIYVVGDEQNYHFQVLKIILQQLEKPYANGVYHLSYGMVELPSGKMKSREGTVVDADDLIAEMTTIAKQHSIELGKIDAFNEEQLERLSFTIGMAALKFYLLRVDPKKKMIFNPEESIDFHGFTGPFIQYTYARICSIIDKNNAPSTSDENAVFLSSLEKELLLEIDLMPHIFEQSLAENNPSLVAVYAYTVAKKFNAFYAQHPILQAENEAIKKMRLRLATFVSYVLKNCAHALGFELPEKM